MSLHSALPNKRWKLAGRTFRVGARLCAKELVPQGGVLAPAGARLAAYARSVRRRSIAR